MRSILTPVESVLVRPAPLAPKSRSLRRDSGMEKTPSPLRSTCAARSLLSVDSAIVVL